MKRIDLTITALSPLAIGQRKPGGSVSEALSYIPGTVIRGAIAKQILKQAGEEPTEGDDFHNLFLDETAAVFRNGYCAIAQTTPGQYALSEQAQVLPTTALSSKANPGFKPNHAGVFDSLIDSYCAKAQGHFYAPNDIEGDLVEPFSGFYSKEGDSYRVHTVNKRLLTRVGINRRRATAQDEILYSLEVMNESQGGSLSGQSQESVQTAFKSSILVEDVSAQEGGELADLLYSFLQQRCTHLRLGGSASRGLGRVQIALNKPTEASAPYLRDRINNFNNRLKERWKLWSLLGGLDASEIKERTFLSLTLQSDAILTECWRRTIVISPDMLAALISVDDAVSEADITLHAAHSSYGYRSGWNAAWGLPKDTELVTNKGSVMLLSLPTEKVDGCIAALEKLEQRGIGDRCEEGYGQVRVCDEFHLVMREESV